MLAVAAQYQENSDDRFVVTLCTALVIHALVILTVGFSMPEKKQVFSKSLEVILVNEHSDTKPITPTHFAQANLEGGGNSEENHSPATPIVAPFPDTKANIVASKNQSSNPKITQQALVAHQEPPSKKEEVEEHDKAKDLEKRKKSQEIVAKKNKSERAQHQKEKLATKQTSEPRVVMDKKAHTQVKDHRDQPSAAQLITNSIAVASLNAEIQQKLEARAKRPKRKFISASTHEYRYAAYMDAWRAKVERIGNLNYPDEARRNKLTGSLILDVALKPSGGVYNVTIRRSSGHKVLDDAAVRIVHLASPFAAFPREIRNEVDILHITRTWQFLSNARFASD